MTSEVKVDKGIPVPVSFPFSEMEVGDSFAVPESIKRTTVNVAAKRYADKHGGKFTVRLMPDRSYRCWRVA